ncbi:hypothetical protein PENNAL_c0072G02604 [Penicillium nalgiovense]|uniref:Uncharacterized protein n=1 Tax=Penicillium nalgiovense TaxID=60175 RepID=A0A1V6XKF4_PENNA|nr:hypothetical protein PENNAL_c0072G02604 [Penicillium nalgiovense]
MPLRLGQCWLGAPWEWSMSAFSCAILAMNSSSGGIICRPAYSGFQRLNVAFSRGRYALYVLYNRNLMHDDLFVRSPFVLAAFEAGGSLLA